MNITERIEQVLSQRGLNKSELARRMNKHNQQVNRLIDNPKWETIEAVASAIGIAPWELFTQEIEAAGYRLAPEQQPAAQPADKMGAAHEVSTEGKQSPGDLPWEKTSTVAEELQAVEEERKMTAAVPGALICPHCGKAMVISVASYEQK